jgi:hypothetical protein
MIALSVVVHHELPDRALKRCLPEEDQAAQTFLFDGTHEPLGESIISSQQLLPVRTLKRFNSRSHTPFTRSAVSGLSSSGVGRTGVKTESRSSTRKAARARY